MTADDSPSMRQMISFTLQEAGFETVEADNGQDALNKLKSGPADMLITDLNMPVMDGLELIRQVRALPQFKYIPIIMLTTESQTEKKAEGKAAGVTGWIVKPFTPDQLVGVVNKVLH